MFLGSTRIFYQFLLSFHDKIVEVEFSHHLSPKIVDGPELRDVGPVRCLGCYIENLPKFPSNDRIEF